MDKNKNKKVTKKTKKLLDKLESQFGNGMKPKSKKDEAVIKKKEKSVQGNSSVKSNPSSKLATLSQSTTVTMKKEKQGDDLKSEGTANSLLQTEILIKGDVETRSPSLIYSSVSKGCVEDVVDSQITRKIPIALQRDAYRETENHPTIEIVKEFISLREKVEHMKDEDIQQQYNAKVLAVRDTKTIKETDARKANKLYSTARQEWMNSNERKSLLKESLQMEMKYDDYSFLHNCWLEFYQSLCHEDVELKEIIVHLPRDGCLLRVNQASTPQDVGIEGIVLYEGENSFILITKNNCVKQVHKRGHLFSVLGIDRQICIYGDYFDIHSVFRLEKQWNRLFSSQRHI